MGRRLGAEDVPETAAELTAWIEAVPDLAMTAEARAAIRFLVLPNLPLPMLPTYAVIAAAAADLLPFHRRRALGLWPVPLADPLVVRPAATSLLALLGWALGPPPLPARRALTPPARRGASARRRDRHVEAAVLGAERRSGAAVGRREPGPEERVVDRDPQQHVRLGPRHLEAEPVERVREPAVVHEPVERR